MRNFDIASLKNRKRTLSRLIAVQSLYQYEFFNQDTDINKIKEDLINNYTLSEDDKVKCYQKNIDQDLVDSLIEYAIENKEKIDQDILEIADKNIQIDRLVKQISRLGAVELLFFKATNHNIIIDEYCNIAGCFYENNKTSFVSSILNKLAKNYNRSEQQDAK